MGVGVARVAPRVVLVPVDAQAQRLAGAAAVGQRLWTQAKRLPVQGVLLVQAARAPAFPPRRHVGARHDPVVRGQGADEGPLVILLRRVVGGRQRHTSGAAAPREDETLG